MPVPMRLNERSTWNRPMNTGICSSIGRQPSRGLKPCSFWSFCISSVILTRSLAYFFRIAWSCGLISCIFFVVRICFTKGLYRIARRVNTRNTTDSAQAMPSPPGLSGVT